MVDYYLYYQNDVENSFIVGALLIDSFLTQQHHCYLSC